MIGCKGFRSNDLGWIEDLDRFDRHSWEKIRLIILILLSQTAEGHDVSLSCSVFVHGSAMMASLEPY